MRDMGADGVEMTAQCLFAELLRICGGMEEQRPPRLLDPARRWIGVVVLLPVRPTYTGHDARRRRVSAMRGAAGYDGYELMGGQWQTSRPSASVGAHETLQDLRPR